MNDLKTPKSFLLLQHHRRIHHYSAPLRLLTLFTKDAGQKTINSSYLSPPSIAAAPQEQPDANGLETSDTSPSLGDEPADKTSSPLSSANLFFDTIGEEQQNENNNNPCKTL